MSQKEINEFEVLLFYGDFDPDKPFEKNIGKFMKDNGFIATLVDNKERWFEDRLRHYYDTFKLITANDSAAKNTEKKVLIFETKGFTPEDFDKMTSKINEALTQFDFEYLFLYNDNNNITLEKADVFFKRIRKELINSDDFKELKKVEPPKKKSSKPAKKIRKKVIIRYTRGFFQEDYDKVIRTINKSIVEFDMNITIIDDRIELEKASTIIGMIEAELDYLKEYKEAKANEPIRKRTTKDNRTN